MANGITLTDSAVTGMSSVIDALADVLDLGFTLFERILENPILLFIFSASMVPVGIKVIKGLKSLAKK